MTRILTEGFEMGDRVGYSGNAVIEAAAKRSGNYGVTIANTYLEIPLSPISELYIRFGYKIATSIFSTSYMKWYKDTTELGSIRFVVTTNKVALYVGTTLVATGATVLVPNTWYLIEVHILFTDTVGDGIIEAKLDGIPEVSYEGDTKPGADTDINKLYFFANNGYIDDIAVNNVTGGVDDSWCGDGKIIAILPNGTAAHQLTGSDADTTDNHLLVDEVPSDSDTTYVEGSVVDERDLYDFAACGLTSVVINRIWAEARARDTVASGGEIALVTKASGGSEVEGGNIALLTSYTARILSAEQLVNPVDSAAWEVADIDAIQAGPKTKS